MLCRVLEVSRAGFYAWLRRPESNHAREDRRLRVLIKTVKALQHALRRRRPQAGLLHHSDQGSTYASEDYRTALEGHGITCSMSRRGDCYDNAAMESWFSTLKAELGERFPSPTETKVALFDYIEVFYNQRRRHSTIGQLSPAEYERRTVPPARSAA